MSLWARIQYLSTDAMKRIYNIYLRNELPIEVRANLAVWIENNILNDNNSGAPGDENTRITMICSELIAEIRRTADMVGNTNMDFAQFRLHSIAQNFMNMMPADLYGRFKACLNEEMQILCEHTNPEPEHVQTQYQDDTERFNARRSANFSQRICTLTNNRAQWVDLLDTMHSVVNELQIVKQRRNTIRTNLQFVGSQQQQTHLNLNGFVNYESNVQREMLKVDQEIDSYNRKIQQLEVDIVKLANVMVAELVDLTPTLLHDYMSKLQWSEVSPEEHGLSLDDIQRWYSELLETISQLRRLWLSHLRQVSPIPIQGLLEQLDPVFFSLISNSLVVQEQPSQVVKKDTKFNTSVRFLSGERFISSQGAPTVKVSVINEKYATLLFDKKSPNEVIYMGHGKIINNVASRFTDGEGRWSQRVIMQFRNVAISAVKRGEKNEKSQKSANRAMTEKFCLLYTSKIDIDGKSYEVWCCSVPFVFIVHVSQKCEGWGNIFWDNSFRESGRIPFSIPQEVTWAMMARALRKCFKVMTETDWNLTDSNLKYIGGKIFKTTEFNDSFIITRKQFCEKEATNRIGHWEWFYYNIELTKKHLAPFWENGFIIGFMDRCYAERDILAKWGPGTFMLRFSDSTLGGVSISYAVGTDGRLEIRSLAPFTDSDLKVRSLPDRIHDAEQFVNVYYHSSKNEERLTAKAQAFPRQNDRNSLFGGPGRLVRSSYVQAEVVMVIASTSNTSGSSSIGQTNGPPHEKVLQEGQPEFDQMQPKRLSTDSPAQSPVGEDVVMDDVGWADFLDGLTFGADLNPEELQDVYQGFENLLMPSPESPEMGHF